MSNRLKYIHNHNIICIFLIFKYIYNIINKGYINNNEVIHNMYLICI